MGRGSPPPGVPLPLAVGKGLCQKTFRFLSSKRRVLEHSGAIFAVELNGNWLCLQNAGDFDDAAGEQEMQSKMRESPARCGRLGRSGLVIYCFFVGLSVMLSTKSTKFGHRYLLHRLSEWDKIWQVDRIGLAVQYLQD